VPFQWEEDEQALRAMRAVKDSLAAPDRGEVEGGPKGCRSTAAVGITSLPRTKWEWGRESERSPTLILPRVRLLWEEG